MNSDRIQAIQSATAYPQSHSVKAALLKVWNECGQELAKEHNEIKARAEKAEAELAEVRKYNSNTDKHLAGVLLGRFEPLAPHHIGWIRERMEYRTDEELGAFIRGKNMNEQAKAEEVSQ